MKENQVSLTAIMCAYLRASHAQYAETKIFNDFLAYQIIPNENRLLIEEGLIKRIQLKAPELASSFPNQEAALKLMTEAMNGRSNILVRSRYTEETLEAAIKEGIKQYVILGAGLDTFAFRHSDMLANLQVFEVDHPNTQNLKIQRIKELGWTVPAQLHFIPIDFTQESLAAALKNSSYNPQAKSFFSWLGVTMYLTREKVFETLRTIATITSTGSKIVFDYFDTDIFVAQKVDSQIQEELAGARAAGEPIVNGFDPTMLALDLSKLGLHLHENLNQAELQKRYLQGRKYAYIAQSIVE